jgi:hypothetical protein
VVQYWQELPHDDYIMMGENCAGLQDQAEKHLCLQLFRFPDYGLFPECFYWLTSLW